MPYLVDIGKIDVNSPFIQKIVKKRAIARLFHSSEAKPRKNYLIRRNIMLNMS
jgi:hypothetical protein